MPARAHPTQSASTKPHPACPAWVLKVPFFVAVFISLMCWLRIFAIIVGPQNCFCVAAGSAASPQSCYISFIATGPAVSLPDLLSFWTWPQDLFCFSPYPQNCFLLLWMPFFSFSLWFSSVSFSPLLIVCWHRLDKIYWSSQQKFL